MDLYSYIDDCAANAVQRVLDEWPTYKYDLDDLIREMIYDECEVVYYSDAYDIIEEARKNWSDWLTQAEELMCDYAFDNYDDHTMALAHQFLIETVTSFFMQRNSGRLLMGV